MKKLNFILKNNSEIVYKEDIQYNVNGNYIVFSFDKNEFKIDLSENFHFIKETNDDIFEIKKNSSSVDAIYTLKEVNMSFDVKVNDFMYTVSNNMYHIKYNLESDSDNVKEIILTID